MSELTVKCGYCGADIDQSRSHGNPREYCSDSHRVMACRARKAEQKQTEADIPDLAPRRLVHRSVPAKILDIISDLS